MSGQAAISHLFDSLAEPFTAEPLFDHLPDVVFFIKDRDGRYLAVNQTLVERCGKQRKSELIGRRPSEVLGEALGRGYESQDRGVLKTGYRLLNQLELHVYRSRDVGWCLTSKFPLIDRDGNTIGLVGVSQDLRLPDVTAEEFRHLDEAIRYVGGHISSPPTIREVAGIARYVEAHISSPPTIREVAGIARMSVYQLDRRMRRVFGLTTGQWVLQTRINHASKRLIDTDLSIAAIALEAGYSDQSSFTRQFRRSTGLSPSDFRNLRRGD
jgi:AraC-like DNA-binding protein